jgi:translation initiation factor 2B subunit (eIF-2B alpha/beta/delta family)
MADRFDDLLAELKNNRESGATSLALLTLSALKDYLDAMPVQSAEKIETLCQALTTARPSMIALGNALQRWQKRLEVAEIDFKQQYLTQLVKVYQQLADASEQVAAHAANLLKPGMTVLTHSRSSQVMALFEQALEQHQDFKVIVTVSAPGNEGLLVASQLNRLDVPVTLITDAEMGLVMSEVDINISGCDSWLTDHHFVNKTGTLLQALAAQHFGKPFWVLADSFKNSHQTSHEVTLEAMPADELPLPEGEKIAAKNVYFETISTRLVAGRVDEHGLQVMQP